MVGTKQTNVAIVIVNDLDKAINALGAVEPFDAMRKRWSRHDGGKRRNEQREERSGPLPAGQREPAKKNEWHGYAQENLVCFECGHQDKRRPHRSKQAAHRRYRADSSPPAS